MRIRRTLIALCAVAALGLAFTASAPQTVAPDTGYTEETLLAGRYHLRNQSSRFFKRATTRTRARTCTGTRCRV